MINKSVGCKFIEENCISRVLLPVMLPVIVVHYVNCCDAQKFGKIIIFLSII